MIVSFWCKRCKLDQDLPAEKRYYYGGGEKFVSKCKCGEELMRLITEKHLDPYFRESEKLRRQRAMMEKELIQPSDPRFRTLYKDEYDRIEKAKENYENEIKKRKERITRYKKELVHDYDKEAVGKVLEKHLLNVG